MKIKKIVFALATCPLLLAVLCEEEEISTVSDRNKTKITLSEGPNFTLNDTLWITGRVSSMLTDLSTGDSIMNSNETIRDIISVMRLQTAVNTSNTTEAVSEFEIVSRIGSIDFLGICPDSELIARAPLTENEQEYVYKIGLVPSNTGDFVLSWLEPADLRNSNLNLQILEQYAFSNSPNSLGLSKCGITSTVLDVRESQREFFFSVN